ncbi:hypothetical protein [Streptomyces sp. FH025]|uniref:hypothetical protein n=1 Tax=Streptomyces sp. FH025 TaxID=2815937 RepID=UPI001A9EDF2B|nr:hypothetical protein [Streptomyces sp. FH025]MBO1418604.1 hypothetical protein [Streptomyces sp. FH025]
MAFALVPKLRTMDAAVTVTAAASWVFRQPIMDILSSDATSGCAAQPTRILVGRVVAPDRVPTADEFQRIRHDHDKGGYPHQKVKMTIRK